jgi:hypothetical protein
MGTPQSRRFRVLAGGLVIAALVFGWAQSARGATISVPKGGNIQTALNGASAGDVVKLAAGGVYNENQLTLNLANLTLTGNCDPDKPRTVIDGGSTYDDVLLVTAANVTVKCVTIRHGGDHLGVDAGADGLKVINIKSLNSKSDGIELDDANGFLVKKSYFAGPHSHAIDAQNTTGGRFENNTIQNVDSDCTYFGNADNLRILNNSSRNCEDGDHVDLWDSSDNALIQGNTWHSSDGACVYLSSGANAEIIDNHCENIEDYGIHAGANGDGLLVENNTFRSIDTGCCSAAVDSDKANTTVKGNKFQSIYRAVDISATDTVVQDNVSIDSGYGAFRVSGKAPVVVNNHATNAGDDDGFNINCSGRCSEGRVENNSTQGTNSDDEGFYINVRNSPRHASKNAGFRIIGNTSSFNNDEGFNIYASSTVIQDNIATDNGGDSYEDGIYVAGGDNTITGNKSYRNVDDGFEIYMETGYAPNTITNNVAKWNLADGFYLTYQGDGNTIDGNKAIANEGEGIENDWTNSIMTNNVSKGNRLDCAGANPAATDSGNVCADGSIFSPTPVDGEID